MRESEIRMRTDEGATFATALGVRNLAIVPTPREKAIKSGDISGRTKITRTDDEKQIAYGEVYAPGRLDTYGEHMTREDIETMAHRFMQLDLRFVIDEAHNEQPNGAIPVESFIARKGDPDYTEGAWVLGVHIPDEGLWQRVKSGELNGFSFSAMVVPREREVAVEVLRDRVGKTEGSEGHEHVFFLQVDAKGKVIAGRTDEIDGHFHEIKRGSTTEKAGDHAHRFFF